MSETKPRAVEMAKRAILERMCNWTITGGGPEYLAFAQAYAMLDTNNREHIANGVIAIANEIMARGGEYNDDVAQRLLSLVGVER